MTDEIQDIQQDIKLEEILNKDGFYVTNFIADGTVAANYGVIFTAYLACEVIAVIMSHSVAGTVGAPTLFIEKLTTGQASGSGVNLTAGGYDLTSTINTPSVKRGLDLTKTGATILKRGDRINLKTSGTLTSVAGVATTLYLRFAKKGSYNI